MSEQEPNEQPGGTEGHSEEHPSRPRALTSEQRRLLGKPRPVHERMDAEKDTVNESGHAEGAGQHHETREPQKPDGKKHFEGESAGSQRAGAERGVRPAIKERNNESSRSGGMKYVALVIGAIVVLGGTFYVGKKFDYLRYLWMTRNNSKLTDNAVDKFPGISAEELVEQALASEHANRLRDAGERLIAAKHKDLTYRGILFRVGKMAFEQGNFDTADRLLERAVSFGENLDTANYLRGVIAMNRHDFPAAERLFAAAASAGPFTADVYYYWAETLRLEHRPREAIVRYEQAAHRTRDDQDRTVCQFKVRIARLECGEDAELQNEIEEKRKAGPLPLDWLMTDAALAISDGRIEDAVGSVIAARAVSARTENGGGIFVSCKGDALFQDACKRHPDLADACEIKSTSP